MPVIEFDNKKIVYKVSGKGTPVLLLHGFGEDGSIWNGIVKNLQKNYLVVVPDIPGSGRSEMLDGDVSLVDFAEVILKISQKEFGRNKSFCLIGHSMGGYISMAFAKKYPKLIKSLGLFHSSAFADDRDKNKKRLKSIAFIKKNGAMEFLKTIIPDLFSEISKVKNLQLPGKLINIAAPILPKALVQYYKAMINRNDTTSVLQSATFPVLFILGKYDKVVPLGTGLKQSHLPSISSVDILESSAHMGMWEQPKKSIGILNDFLGEFA